MHWTAIVFIVLAVVVFLFNFNARRKSMKDSQSRREMRFKSDEEQSLQAEQNRLFQEQVNRNNQQFQDDAQRANEQAMRDAQMHNQNSDNFPPTDFGSPFGL